MFARIYLSTHHPQILRSDKTILQRILTNKLLVIWLGLNKNAPHNPLNNLLNHIFLLNFFLQIVHLRICELSREIAWLLEKNCESNFSKEEFVFPGANP